MPTGTPEGPAVRRGTSYRVVRVLATVVVAPVALGALVVLVLATTPWGNERVRRLLVSQANDRLTGTVSIASMQGNLFADAVLTDVNVLDSAKQPVFAARRVQVRYALWPALHGQVVLRSLTLDSTTIVMDKRSGADWNFQTLVRPTGAIKDTSRHMATPVLENITVRHGRFLYRRPWVPDSTVSQAARDSQIAAALSPSARRRTEAVAGGYQRVLDYHDLDATLTSVVIAHNGQPTAVAIASLSMLAEPYRPPAIDVRSLVGVLLVSKDSLWWRGAHMRLPASDVSGDGTIGFHRSGLRLDLTGAPIALADLRWLNPKLPTEGGGGLRYAMHFHGDTADFDVTGANVHYRTATLVGHGGLSRISPPKEKSAMVIRGTDLTIAGLTTSIIHELAPNVVISRSGVIDGHIALSGAPHALELDADVRFADATAGVSHILARGGMGMENGVSAHDLAITLRPLRAITLAAAGVHLPLAGEFTGIATINGTLREGGSVRGDLTLTDHGNRSHIKGTGSYQVNSKRIAATATLDSLSLASAGRFVPAAQLHGAVAGDVHVEGTTRDIRFRSALRSLEGGGLDAHGSVSLRGAASRYDIVAVLDSLSARAFTPKAPIARMSGRASVRGTGFAPATINAVADIDLARSSYDTFFVDGLSAHGSAADGVVRVDTLMLHASGVQLTAKGSLGLIPERAGTLAFSAQADSLSTLGNVLGTSDTGSVHAPALKQRTLLLAARADSGRRADSARIERLALGLPQGVALMMDSLPSLRRDSLAGRVAAHGSLTGNTSALAMEATVTGDGIVARGSSVRHLNAAISSRNVRDSVPSIAFRARADTIETNGLAFERAQTDGSWRRSNLDIGLSIQQDARVSYLLSGGYGRTAADGYDVRIARLRAAFDTLVWETVRPARVRIDHEVFAIDSLLLRNSGGGRLFANGVVSSSGAANLDVAAEGVRISTVLRAMQRDSTGEGVVDVHAHIDGTRADPGITGNAALHGAVYQGTRAPDAAVGLRYRDTRLSLDATARDSNGRRVLVGTAVLPLNLSFDSVSGSRLVAGPLSADVVLDSLKLAALPLASRGLEDIGGALTADAHVSGSWSTPRYTGSAAVRDGALTLNATNMRMQGVVADVRVSGDTVRLDSLVARAGGSLRAWGTVDMHDPARPFVNLSATGENLRVMDQHRGLVDADADIFAIGPLDALRVTGRGEMRDGFLALKQFRKDLLRVKAPGDLSFLAVFDTSAPPNEATRLRLARAEKKRVAIIADLAMTVDRGNYYRNRPDANTEFYTDRGEELRVHLDQRTDDQWVVGFVRIGEGVAFFRTRPFTPAHGALTFEPHTDAPGIVQQVGERLIWEPGRGWFPLQLFTGGTSKGPSVGLESGTLFPLRGRELNGYLTLGRSSTTLLQQTGSSLSGSASWSGQLSGESGALAHRQQGATALGVMLHDIGTGATKAFDLDALSVSPSDVPTELVFGKTGGVRGALVEAGTYLTTDRYVAGEFHLTSGIPGFRIAQRFGTTYRLDFGVEPRFLFRAPEELGITHPTIRTGVLGMFLTRFWDF
ncbi:MAG: translocation/assembly module TamB domain-containing protein [bacterium]